MDRIEEDPEYHMALTDPVGGVGAPSAAPPTQSICKYTRTRGVRFAFLPVPGLADRNVTAGQPSVVILGGADSLPR